MNKGMIMLAIAGAIIVTGAGAAGAILALNSDSHTNTVPQNAETSKKQPQEVVKLNGWKDENGSWYFYKNNEKQKNWMQDKNSWYYLGSDGKMRTDWIKDNETWYYLNKDGTMATNTTIDNCYLNEKGIIEKTPINNKNSASDDNSENGSTSKHSVSSFEEARNIILKEDGQHIQNENKEISKSNSYIQLNNYKQETIKDEAGGWGIPNEECYSILISNYYNGEEDSDSGMYLVGIKTGNVYILPHQGGVPAYQIKNNQVVKRFYGVGSGASNHEWR